VVFGCIVLAAAAAGAWSRWEWVGTCIGAATAALPRGEPGVSCPIP